MENDSQNQPPSPSSSARAVPHSCDTQLAKVEYFHESHTSSGSIVHEIKIEIEGDVGEEDVFRQEEPHDIAAVSHAVPDHVIGQIPILSEPTNDTLVEESRTTKANADLLDEIFHSWAINEEKKTEPVINQSKFDLTGSVDAVKYPAVVSDTVEPDTRTWRNMRDHCMEVPISRENTNQGLCLSSEEASPDGSIYQIKWITFLGTQVGIVTQNKNGPCPLISVINVLLLSRRMQLESGIEYQSGENLLSQLASLILECVPEKASEEVVRNYEQNIQDVLAILPKLQTGIDINVKFTSPLHYEFTQETLFFDLLDVPLVHGWIPDSSDPARVVVNRIGSYNGIVEFVINGKTSDDPVSAHDALLAEDWLERTQSQMTYAGLIALSEGLTNHVPCVLFRNNHFSVIIRHENQIFALVTDQGYATEMSCVWERLNGIEGDTDFFDDRFCQRISPKPLISAGSPVKDSTPSLMDVDHQMELDRQLAMSLAQQQEQEEFAAPSLPTQRPRFGRVRPTADTPSQEPLQMETTNPTSITIQRSPRHEPQSRPNPVFSSQSAYQLQNVLHDLPPTLPISMSSSGGDGGGPVPPAHLPPLSERRYDSEHNLQSLHHQHSHLPYPASLQDPAGSSLAHHHAVSNSIPINRRLPQSSFTMASSEGSGGKNKQDKCVIS